MSVDWLAMQNFANGMGGLAADIDPSTLSARRQALAEQHLLSINQRHRVNQQNYAANRAQRQAHFQTNQAYRQQSLAQRQAQFQTRQLNVQATRQSRMQEYQRRTLERFGNSALAAFTRRTHARIATMPNPGGVGLVVGTILLLLVFLIPTNSKKETRAQHVFAVALGQEELPLPNQLAGHDTIHIGIKNGPGVTISPSELFGDIGTLLNDIGSFHTGLGGGFGNGSGSSLSQPTFDAASTFNFLSNPFNPQLPNG